MKDRILEILKGIMWLVLLLADGLEMQYDDDVVMDCVKRDRVCKGQRDSERGICQGHSDVVAAYMELFMEIESAHKDIAYDVCLQYCRFAAIYVNS